MNRLAVPLYFNTSLSIGYDSNFLRFSGDDIDDANFSDWMLGESSYFDSDIIKPEIRLTYSPVLHIDQETKISLRLAYSEYGQLAQKSYGSMSAAIAQHLGSYKWFTLGYGRVPNIFLRYYHDSDSITRESQICKFTSESAYVSYSLPIYRKTWIRLKVMMNNQYFNPEFTEFDTEISSFEGRIYTRIVSDSRLSFWLKLGDGDNISFQNGLISTKTDRSYSVTSSGFLASYYPQNTFKAIHFLFSSEYREYNSNDINDPLHQGRIHWDYKSSVWFDKEFTTQISGEFRINYRVRKTDSQFDWVSSLKSFRKYEMWLKFTYDFTLDLFY
ncbi:MAG: hypothetical protein ACE5D7_03775 [Fidelibacterota bacterium]